MGYLLFRPSAGVIKATATENRQHFMQSAVSDKKMLNIAINAK